MLLAQLLLEQPLLPEHGAPFAPRPQAPAPLQLFGAPGQSSCGSSPAQVMEHVPTRPVTLHELHNVVHAVLQQTPSTQKPVRHSPAAPQPCPWIFLQLPLPSHWLLPVHAATGLLSV